MKLPCNWGGLIDLQFVDLYLVFFLILSVIFLYFLCLISIKSVCMHAAVKRKQKIYAKLGKLPMEKTVILKSYVILSHFRI